MRTILASLGGHHVEVVALVQQCAEAGFPASLAGQVAQWVLDHLGGRLDEYDTSVDVQY